MVLIKDLGLRFATDMSKRKERFCLYECKECGEKYERRYFDEKYRGASANCVDCEKLDKGKPLRVCKDCGFEALSTDDLENFSTDVNAKYGRQKICKTCKDIKTTLHRSTKEGRKAYNERQRKFNLSEAGRIGHVRRKYGLSKEQYFKLVEDSDGFCKICGRLPTSGARLSVDHCHHSGKVRGLICNNCNAGLGLFKDDISILVNAIEYLNNTEETDNDEK